MGLLRSWRLPSRAVNLAGRTAIVSGAGTGLGRASALGLAREGAAVVVAGLGLEGLEETARLIREEGGRALPVECDIADEGAIARMAALALTEFGGADVLVNNAAIYPSRPWHEADAEEWDAVMRVNVRGYFLCAKAVRPQMLARGGGSIVNIASVTFYEGTALLVSYVASKGAVIGFTRALAREAGPEGIRVNAVAPGAFPTAATDFWEDQEALWRGVLESQSIKRRGRPEDVADAVCFFASDSSSFVTGQTLLVDGGWMRG
jgi:NAD(P)-dependent dehydrogenase (short-subunit alcohol dehydrogenase family)